MRCTQCKNTGIGILFAQVCVGRQLVYGFVCGLAMPERGMVFAGDRLRANCGLRLGTQPLKLRKRARKALFPPKNCRDLLMRLVIGNIHLNHFLAHA